MGHERQTDSDIAIEPKPALAEIWARSRRRLKTQLGEQVFISWFGRLELDRVEDDVAYLSVPTRFLKTWIQSHYNDRILATLTAEAPYVKRLEISERAAARAANARSVAAVVEAQRLLEATPPMHPSDEPVQMAAAMSEQVFGRVEPGSTIDGFTGSPLDRRLSFSTFLVGRSNQLAFAAAERLIAGPSTDTPPYNPLYIHASVGLGKTHLMQAISQAAPGQKRRAIYLTAEKFMFGFVSAIKAQTAITFKEKLRAIDVLVIDDVQFLQGKSIQNEFCHTLNSLIDAGRQIVVAADRPPADLESLDDRVRSRLAGGLCVEMGPLDEALRVSMLEMRIAAARSAHPGFDVSPAVIAHVARAISTNGRDLDGAVHRLVAHASLGGVPLTIETADAAIRDLVRTREPKRVKIEDIQKLVASHYNVSRADILSSRRTANVVLPRQIAMFLAKSLTLRSLPEIGRRFGGRDHTTVLHAIRKIDALAKQDINVGEEIELLRRTLQD